MVEIKETDPQMFAQLVAETPDWVQWMDGVNWSKLETKITVN
ncbi:hypothetical protein [Nostoc sp. FACHB-888]|nr:hypothetical protein [Nostoc sp. FACHB-888]